MVILGDYHTHTIHSDGTSTVMENAEWAKKVGLKEIAITDHGFYKLGGMKKSDVEKIKQQAKIATEQTGVKVYVGVEATIISKTGEIDVSLEEITMFDVLIVGFHQILKKCSLASRFGFVLANNLGIKTKKRKQINTSALCKAMQKYPIDIISHPGVGCAVDFVELAKVAKQTNTYLEINGKRIAYKKEDIKALVQMQTKFVMSSDAHKYKNVGNCKKTMNFAFKYNIPRELIANINNTLVLKNKC